MRHNCSVMLLTRKPFLTMFPMRFMTVETYRFKKVSGFRIPGSVPKERFMIVAEKKEVKPKVTMFSEERIQQTLEKKLKEEKRAEKKKKKEEKKELE